MRIGTDHIGFGDWVTLGSRADGRAARTGAGTSAGGDRVSKAEGTDSPASVSRGQCKTCAERKYQDVSTDPSVSFQTPTSLAPGTEAAAVRAHEQEHVTHNAARAEREGMTARSTVVIHTDVCPECGRPFVSGGTTTTTYSSKAMLARADEERGQMIDAVA